MFLKPQDSKDPEIPVQDRAGRLDHGIGERIGVLYVKPFFIQKMKQHFNHTACQRIKHEPGIGIRSIFPESDVFFQLVFQDLTVFKRKRTAVIIHKERLKIETVFIEQFLECGQQICVGVVGETVFFRDPAGFPQEKQLMFLYTVKNVSDGFIVLIESGTMDAGFLNDLPHCDAPEILFQVQFPEGSFNFLPGPASGGYIL